MPPEEKAFLAEVDDANAADHSSTDAKAGEPDAAADAPEGATDADAPTAGKPEVVEEEQHLEQVSTDMPATLPVDEEACDGQSLALSMPRQPAPALSSPGQLMGPGQFADLAATFNVSVVDGRAAVKEPEPNMLTDEMNAPLSSYARLEDGEAPPEQLDVQETPDQSAVWDLAASLVAGHAKIADSSVLGDLSTSEHCESSNSAAASHPDTLQKLVSPLIGESGASVANPTFLVSDVPQPEPEEESAPDAVISRQVPGAGNLDCETALTRSKLEHIAMRLRSCRAGLEEGAKAGHVVAATDATFVDIDLCNSDLPEESLKEESLKEESVLDGYVSDDQTVVQEGENVNVLPPKPSRIWVDYFESMETKEQLQFAMEVRHSLCNTLREAPAPPLRLRRNAGDQEEDLLLLSGEPQTFFSQANTSTAPSRSDWLSKLRSSVFAPCVCDPEDGGNTAVHESKMEVVQVHELAKDKTDPWRASRQPVKRRPSTTQNYAPNRRAERAHSDDLNYWNIPSAGTVLYDGPPTLVNQPPWV